MRALGDVLKAIVDRFRSDLNLPRAISGGIHLNRGEDLTAPYVIVGSVASTVGLRTTGAAGTTTGNEYGRRSIQLTLYTAGGPEAAQVLVRRIRNRFDWAPLTIDNETLVYCKFTDERILPDPESPGNANATVWALTYEVLAAEARTLSPT
jgi:hypothetical protein